MTAAEAMPVPEESKKQPLAVRVGAELVGSFFICFAIYTICTLDAIVSNLNMAFIALMTGAAYAVMTLVFGKISGGQFNPAVSIAAMLTGKTHVLDGILYIIAQLLGGIGAGAALRFLLPTSEQVPFKSWLSLAVNGFDKASISYSTLSSLGLSFGITLAVVVELIAGLIIVATAMRSMGERGASNTKHAIAMGLAYAVGTTITYPVTGAVVALVIIVFTMMLSPNKKNAKADEGDDAQGEESSETEEDLHADGEQDEQDKQSDSQSDADEGIENN